MVIVANRITTRTKNVIHPTEKCDVHRRRRTKPLLLSPGNQLGVSPENIFTVSNGIVNTPPLSSSVLPGITRDSVIQICGELGIAIKERTIQRAALYVADELFFSGTAAEITPIRSVDRITVGGGGRGEITEKIQSAFFEITKGERKAPGDWLTYIRAVKSPQPGNNGSQSRQEARGESEKDADVSISADRQSEPAMKYQTAANAVD